MKRVWSSAALAAMLAMPLTNRAADAAAVGRETPPAGAVTALSVVPSSGHADVLIAVDGPAIALSIWRVSSDSSTNCWIAWRFFRRTGSIARAISSDFSAR